MKSVSERLLVVALCCLFSVAAHALRTDKIMVPKEVVDRLRVDFDTRNTELKPVRIPIEVEFTGDNFSRRVTLDVGKRTLELSAFINQRLRKFTMKLHVQSDVNDTTRLYFISRYKQSQAQSEKWGLGCNKIALLKSQMDQLVNGSGVSLDLLNGHYINVVGGDYLLAHKDGDILYFAYFRLRDRRWVDRLCKVQF